MLLAVSVSVAHSFVGQGKGHQLQEKSKGGQNNGDENIEWGGVIRKSVGGGAYKM